MTAATATKPDAPSVVPLRSGIVPRSDEALRADYSAFAAAYLRAVFNGGSVDILKTRVKTRSRARTGI